VVAFPGGAGTLSEIALALKSPRPVVTIGFPLGPVFSAYRDCGLLLEAETVPEAMAAVARLLREA
jgi:predicted Rossmann-fold nucleotide-binding protein